MAIEAEGDQKENGGTTWAFFNSIGRCMSWIAINGERLGRGLCTAVGLITDDIFFITFSL